MSRVTTLEGLPAGSAESSAVRSTGPSYRVWAPTARRVELRLDGHRRFMSQGPDGWWDCFYPMRAGTRYGFVVDGEGPFPDPRSLFQPDGVHDLSQVVDHRAFIWSDHRWEPPPLAGGILYEMHIGTFTEAGTFASAIDKLDHLSGLGVSHIELMPVAEFSGQCGWGYDGVSLFAPHHAYGRPDDLKLFVDACHSRRLAVIIDVVYNHLGPCGNYLPRFGPYLTECYRTPWGSAINLDGRGSDEVRRFLCDNATMWLRDYHADGIRLDAIHAFHDRSAVTFLEQITSEVHRLETVLGRHLTVIAESDLNDPRVVQSPEAGGFGVDAQWTDDFHHALHGVLTGERAGYYADFGAHDQLVAALSRPFVYAGHYSEFRGRRHGRSADGLPGSRFIVSTQNHDQIGNRAAGDRLSHLVSPGRAKIAAALLLTSPFVPLLFQGEEWAAGSPFRYFTSHEEPDLARDVTESRRREFGAFGWQPCDVPDPQAADTLLASRLRWEELNQPWHAEMLAWYRDLLTLRRELPELRDGDYRRVTARFDTDGVLEVRRGRVLLVANLGSELRSVPTEGRAVLWSHPYECAASRLLSVKPDSVVICVREHERCV